MLEVAADIAVVGDAAPVSNVVRRYLFGVVDALAWLTAVELPSTALIYCDPPYLGCTRSQERPLYQHEMMSEAEHIKLLTILLGLDCMVMISGYWSELYDDLLCGWRRVDIPTYTRSNRSVTECVWMNYEKPTRLHDYDYLGDSFRERERIKRKRKRWMKRFAELSVLERNAILSAMAEKDLI